ncbi:hypothetical protein [Flavobacterium sp.]|uniref:hypothetical protein n=1 Tax=Flavobacterium sp. TaxID=239 RepID=UPI003A8D60CD
MTQQEIDLFDRMKLYGGPGRNRGNIIGFYPSDEFLRILTIEYNAEFASVFTMGINTHYLWVGTIDSILLPSAVNGNHEILIKHTHPKGTAQPSCFDIDWLFKAQKEGSPQTKSLILPIGKDRVSFNINTPYL